MQGQVGKIVRIVGDNVVAIDHGHIGQVCGMLADGFVDATEGATLEVLPLLQGAPNGGDGKNGGVGIILGNIFLVFSVVYKLIANRI